MSRHKKLRQLAITGACGILLIGGGIWLAQNYLQQQQLKSAASQEEDAYDEGEDTDDLKTVVWKGETYRYNDHLSNFLFLGIDTRETVETETGKEDAGQADALYLISWDRVDNQVHLISIPRDTMTPIEIFDMKGNSLGLSENHISLSYGYGDGRYGSLELTETAVSDLFYGIPIQGACAMSLDGIPELVRSLGDVQVVVPNDSLEERYPEFQKGKTVTITPDNAEIFLRNRDTGVSQTAIARMERQQAFLQAVEEMVTKDTSKLTQAYEDMTPYLVSSISNDWLVKLTDAVSKTETVDRWTVPGEGTEGEMFDEYHVDSDALYQKVLETFYKRAE